MALDLQLRVTRVPVPGVPPRGDAVMALLAEHPLRAVARWSLMLCLLGMPFPMYEV